MANDNERYVNYLNFSTSWKRPEGPPRVWRIIDGHRKSISGQTLKFSIQEVPKELEENVVDFMARCFIREEPLSVGLGIGKDALAIRECRTLWRDALQQGVSTVALLVNSDLSAKPVIAGVDVLGIVNAEDDGNMLQFQSSILKKSTAVCIKLIQESDASRKYGVDMYLRAFGLSVHPCFREQGLGEELLRAHNDIGLAYQIPLTANIFTSTASQTVATNLGYEVLVERKYSELLDDEGKVVFPDMTNETIKIMAKRLC